jgi:hypothetical protein
MLNAKSGVACVWLSPLKPRRHAEDNDVRFSH